MIYKKKKDGEWIQPRMSGYKMQCCDCGLIHKIDFAVVDPKTGELLNGPSVAFRAYRVEKKKKKGKKK